MAHYFKRNYEMRKPAQTLPVAHYRTLSHMISDTWNSAAGYAVRATLRREVALLAQAESILKSSDMHAQPVGSSV